jgi:DNA polymerase V
MTQLDLFAADNDTHEEESLAREKSRQKAVLHIQKKYGKNAIVKGMNLQEGATTMDRNRQIGGHKA